MKSVVADVTSLLDGQDKETIHFTLRFWMWLGRFATIAWRKYRGLQKERAIMPDKPICFKETNPDMVDPE